MSRDPEPQWIVLKALPRQCEQGDSSRGQAKDDRDYIQAITALTVRRSW